jgi:hypothetical protein
MYVQNTTNSKSMYLLTTECSLQDFTFETQQQYAEEELN